MSSSTRKENWGTVRQLWAVLACIVLVWRRGGAGILVYWPDFCAEG